MKWSVKEYYKHSVLAQEWRGCGIEKPTFIEACQRVCLLCSIQTDCRGMSMPLEDPNQHFIHTVKWLVKERIYWYNIGYQ